MVPARQTTHGARCATLGAIALTLLMPAAQTAADTAAPSLAGPDSEERALHFDFPGVEVGVAEHEQGPTGVTVVHFSKPVTVAVDVRGGAPGTMNTELLRLSYERPLVGAITIAGGWVYGLGAASGVASALKERTPDAGKWERQVIVVAADIFDLGARRYTTNTPDEQLGRRALESARPGVFPLGARGAGRLAMQGSFYGDWQHSGQGAALRQSGPIKTLVFTVVNAYGSIVDRDGRVQRCSHPLNGDCGPIAHRIDAYLRGLAPQAPGGKSEASGAAEPVAATNTTITVVVTNQKLPFWSLQRLAVQVHNSMGRGIQPFGTQYDGDTLFAASTGELDGGSLSNEDLALLASETAWDAVLASLPELPPPGPEGPLAIAPAALHSYVGLYQFAPGASARIRQGSTELEIEAHGHDSIYLPADRTVAMRAVGTDQFVLETDRADRLHIDRDTHGRVVGLTINPGPWAIRAQRIAHRE